ncbi:hypothetical protein EJ070_01075 [Mesorhizobium sp. M1E.F.Ca.ET.045.02.1.1]|nr:hypothetical protein EJ070_01075 [Mesorhizobium sp. M1E.F.Ca.ET.045.02.1.1]
MTSMHRIGHHLGNSVRASGSPGHRGGSVCRRPPKVKANSKRIGFKPSGRKPGRRTDFTNDPGSLPDVAGAFPP